MMSRALKVLFFLMIFFAVSCDDDQLQKEEHVIEPEIIIPDLEDKTEASLSGFVTNESGEALVSAEVQAGDKQVLTDEYGFFNIKDASVAKYAAQISVDAAGFFRAYKTITPNDEHAGFVRITLINKSEAKTISGATGGMVTVEGAKLQFMANSTVIAATGTSYEGEVQVHARMLYPDEIGLQPGLPGDGRGVDEAGHAKLLQSFAPMVVELTTPGGQHLQLAQGKPAMLTLPIASPLIGDAPNTISLWSYNTTTGLWEEQGRAEKSGNAYIGAVTHFSFWDAAIGVSMVNITAQVVNEANQPLVHVPVRVTLAGQPLNAGHGRFGYTDANGEITGAVFANKDYVLDVLTPCNITAYTHPFTVVSSDLDLGKVTGNLGQNSVTISGNVHNCDGENITSGYVQTYDGTFFNRFPVVNGVFTFTGIMCTNTTISLVAVDLATNVQSTPLEVTLAAGANAIGTLDVCAESTMGHITYTFDGVTETIQEPTDTLGAYMLDGVAGTQILTLSGSPNDHQKMAFQLVGEPTPGTHKVKEVFSEIFPSGRGYWPVDINVTITEYGAPGGFIVGEFSSNMLDFKDNSLHTLSCSFRVRRNR